MAKKTSSFLVGLFVTLGLVLGTVLIIWVGASRYFEPGNRYATYFDESVQGLQKDSTVKYRGVDVGRVERIRVAPDNHLVEVVMKIDLTEDIRKGMAAELKSAGITGIMFVELARISPGERVSTPKITFATEYPGDPVPHLDDAEGLLAGRGGHGEDEGGRLRGGVRPVQGHGEGGGAVLRRPADPRHGREPGADDPADRRDGRPDRQHPLRGAAGEGRRRDRGGPRRGSGSSS